MSCRVRRLAFRSSPPGYLAYIDESGQRSRTGRSSPHFILSAVVIQADKQAEATAFVASLRNRHGRRPSDTLHWKNYNQHDKRLLASSAVGAQKSLFRVCSVVVCKDHLPDEPDKWNQDRAYLYTLRFLLERLSWIARDGQRGGGLRYTLAHVRRFKLSKLRQYEYRLMEQGTEISWNHLDPAGGQIDQPNRLDLLQIADIAASATGAAFNPRQGDGTVQTQYLRKLEPVMYRRQAGSITSYGLKMHPWNSGTKAA